VHPKALNYFRQASADVSAVEQMTPFSARSALEISRHVHPGKKPGAFNNRSALTKFVNECRIQFHSMERMSNMFFSLKRHATAASVALAFGVFVTAPSFGQSLAASVVADNFYGLYTGTATGGSLAGPHLKGSWPTPATGNINLGGTDTHVYVLVWGDNSSLQGFMADLRIASAQVNTGSPFWEVCATGQTLNQGVANLPNNASISARISACNNGSQWRPTKNGKNNEHAVTGLWGRVNGIDPTAAWVWYPQSGCSDNVNDSNYFLRAACKTPEYLIFRVPVERIRGCRPPVPAFSVNCQGPSCGAFVADATASSGELQYFWSVEESDANWGRKGGEIMQWFTGQAGPLDLRAFVDSKAPNAPIKCNVPYRVKLAVANQCVSWRDITKLVTFTCSCRVLEPAQPSTNSGSVTFRQD
jgi:hypothetical protein